MAEDGKFCIHNGVDWSELGKVLDRSAGPNRGASTIAMQSVKNLFLWPSRSYLRKAIEMPIALYADLLWGKKREMEIYLNVVEEGVRGGDGAPLLQARRQGAHRGQAALSPRHCRTRPRAVRPPDPAGAGGAAPLRQARASGAYVDCLYR
jgi:monofunctional biosynthetic peptidoglycan transglycosylase